MKYRPIAEMLNGIRGDCAWRLVDACVGPARQNASRGHPQKARTARITAGSPTWDLFAFLQERTGARAQHKKPATDTVESSP